MAAADLGAVVRHLLLEPNVLARVVPPRGMSGQEYIVHILAQLEGPYKWYVIGFIAVLLTALVTRFIFKTFKWFFLLAILAILIFALIGVLARLAQVSPTIS